jgi:hypothetical protein
MVNIAKRFTRDIITPVNNIAYDVEVLKIFQAGRLF